MRYAVIFVFGLLALSACGLPGAEVETRSPSPQPADEFATAVHGTVVAAASETASAVSTTPPATHSPVPTTPVGDAVTPVSPTVTASPVPPTLFPPTPSPLPPTAVPPTPSLLPPTATSPKVISMEIIHFSVSPEVVDPGEPVTFTWETRGGTEAVLWRLWPTGQYGTWWTVALNGSLTVETDPDDRNYRSFVLILLDENDGHVQEMLTVTFTCPDVWFFSPAPEGCPRATGHSPASEQHFERGRMIWLGAYETIYVLYDDGQTPAWRAFFDDWVEVEGDLADDLALTPPPGLFQPVRGFGKVWRENETVRERLGWALGPEQAFSGVYQSSSLPKYNHFYLLSANQRVIHLMPESSGWEILTP